MKRTKKDIVIIADFCGSFEGNGNNRFLYIADKLADSNDVEIITSDFMHSKKKYYDYVPQNDRYKITLLHEGFYQTNVCIRRFWAHFLWGKSVKTYMKTRKKPDIIYCAVPPLKAAIEIAKYCKKNEVKFAIDVQDLWPEAFSMVFNYPLISSIIFKPFEYLANKTYEYADEVIAVSETYLKRAMTANRKDAKGYSIFLGTDINMFDRYVYENNVCDKQTGEFWVGYCGTLGASYDLSCVIDALALINKKDIIYKLIVMGDGPRRKEFEEYAKKCGVDTVFFGKLPYPQMCGRLSACDIAVNPIMPKAAASIINKHADYAAAGLPVINTQENKEYRFLVKHYQMGFNCKNGDSEMVAKYIVKLSENDKLRIKMGCNARKCAEEKFDRSKTYNAIINYCV